MISHNLTKDDFNYGGFEYICSLKQYELYLFILNGIKEYYSEEDIIATDDYIFLKGDIPIMFLSHLDTVHKSVPCDIFSDKERGKITCLQGIGGDDRCGVYSLLYMIEHLKQKPYILFTTDEEVGCVGAGIASTEILKNTVSDVKFMVEIDRKGSKDAVFYACENTDFHNFITDNTGYKKEYGSCSDISKVGPKWDIAAVNLSSGYYNAHQTTEYVVVDELMNTIGMCMGLAELSKSEDVPYFNYQERSYSYSGASTVYSGTNYYNDDNYYDKYYCGRSTTSKKDTTSDVYDKEVEDYVKSVTNTFSSMTDKEWEECYDEYMKRMN